MISLFKVHLLQFFKKRIALHFLSIGHANMLFNMNERRLIDITGLDLWDINITAESIHTKFYTLQCVICNTNKFSTFW